MKKIFLILFLLILSSNNIFSQATRINLGGYDDIDNHFGFLLGLHSSYYRIDYSSDFTSNDFNNLHSIHSKSMPGFKLGFISDFKLYYPFDLRTLLQVSFSECTFWEQNSEFILRMHVFGVRIRAADVRLQNLG